MSWRRYDDRYERHPKILELIATTGYEGYYRLMRLHGYSAEFNTEGHVNSAAIADCGVKPKQLRAMIQLRLLDETENGLVIHDWDDYNPATTGNAARQKRYRDRHRNGDRNVTQDVTRDATSNATSDVTSNAPHARASAPVPLPLPQVLTATETGSEERETPANGSGPGHGEPPAVEKIDFDSILKEL